MTAKLFEAVGYKPSGSCDNCDGQKDLLLIKTEAYTAGVCAKCVMREAKKRTPKPEAKKEESKDGLFDRAGVP